ncbi:MAG: hypothetical protein ABIJ97_00695 [Bacteroidota bacterium]
MRIIAICLLLTFCFTGYNQTPEKNHEKYLTYRERLKYFHSNGTGPGENLISSIQGMGLNKSKILNFGGDQTIELSWYIGMLATEYKLLSLNNQNTKKTLKELYYALMTLKRLDECENKEPWNLPESKFDGFFMRADIPDNEYTTKRSSHFNMNLLPTDTFKSVPPGHPIFVDRVRYSNIEMSQDQVIHMLMALSLVVKCFPDTTLIFAKLDNNMQQFNYHQFAANQINRIIRYINNDNFQNGPKKWVIYNPKGEKVHLGSDASVFAYAFAKTGQKQTGNVYMKDLKAKISRRILWELAKIPTPNEWNASMACILAALSDSWAFTNGTDKSIYGSSEKYDWDTYYMLLWQFINNKKSNYTDLDKIIYQLNTAPENGTYYYGPDSVEVKNYGQTGSPCCGWASNNRFRNTIKETAGRISFIGNYNGLDYMLLYNLYRLNYCPGNYIKSE